VHKRAVVVLRQLLQAHDVEIGWCSAPATLLDQARSGPVRASKRGSRQHGGLCRKYMRGPPRRGVRLKLAVLEEPLRAALHHNLKACTSAQAEGRAARRSVSISCVLRKVYSTARCVPCSMRALTTEGVRAVRCSSGLVSPRSQSRTGAIVRCSRGPSGPVGLEKNRQSA